MNLRGTIRSSLKAGKTVIGYKRSVKFLKTSPASVSKIIIAKNTPDEMKHEIKHSADIAKKEVEVFDGSSKELGIVCGKSFPITTLVVKK